MGEKSTSLFAAVYLYSMGTFFSNRYFCLYIWDIRQYQKFETIGIIPRSEPIIMAQIKKVSHTSHYWAMSLDTHIRPTARFPTVDQYQCWIQLMLIMVVLFPGLWLAPLLTLSAWSRWIVSTKVYWVNTQSRWLGNEDEAGGWEYEGMRPVT